MLAAVNQELALQLVTTIVSSQTERSYLDYDLAGSLGQALPTLADSFPDEVILLAQSLISLNRNSDSVAFAIKAIGRTLPHISEPRREELLNLIDGYTITTEHTGSTERSGAVACAEFIASFDIERAVKLIENHLTDDIYKVRSEAVLAIRGVMAVDQERAINLLQQVLAQPNLPQEITQLIPDLIRLSSPAAVDIIQALFLHKNDYNMYSYQSDIMKHMSTIAAKDPSTAVRLITDVFTVRGSYQHQAALDIIPVLLDLAPTETLPLIETAFNSAYAYQQTKLFPLITTLFERGYTKQAALLVERELTEYSLSDSASSEQHLVTLITSDPLAALDIIRKIAREDNLSARLHIYRMLPAIKTAYPTELEHLTQRGLSDSSQEIRLISLRAMDFVSSPQTHVELVRIEQALQAKIAEGVLLDEELPFVHVRVNFLLRTGGDLGTILSHDIPKIRELREEIKRVNQTLPPAKALGNVDKFFVDNLPAIAKLVTIDERLLIALLTSPRRIEQLGYSRIEQTIQTAGNLNLEILPTISQILQSVGNRDEVFLERVIFLADTYQNLELNEEFSQLTATFERNMSQKDVLRILGQTLMEQFARSLGISATIREGALEDWNLEYLSNLFAAEKKFTEGSREYLRLVIKATLQGDFSSIRMRQLDALQGTYTAEELKLIRELATHNEGVEATLKDAGIDYDTWVHYSGTRNFSVSSSQDYAQNAQLRGIQDNFITSTEELLQQQELPEVVSHIQQMLQEHGFFINNSARLNRDALTIPQLQAGVRELIEYLQSQAEVIGGNTNVTTLLAHFVGMQQDLEGINNVLARSTMNLRISQWKANPGQDLFQGNETACCIAIDNSNQGAIVDYLLDTGMTILEVRDINTGRIAGQTFAFIGEDPEGNQILVLDNVEINARYAVASDGIRDELFAYAKEFAQALSTNGQQNIAYVVLGTLYNDVKTAGMPRRNINLKKTTGNGVLDTQYLDAFGGWKDPSVRTQREYTIVWTNPEAQIRHPVPVPRIAARDLQVELVTHFEPTTVQQIVALESAFPSALQADAEEVLEEYDRPDAVNIVLRDPSGAVRGFLGAIPHNDVVSELRLGGDDNTQPNDSALYVGTLAIAPQVRGIEIFDQVLSRIIEQAKTRGFTSLTMHARGLRDGTRPGLGPLLARRYASALVTQRRIDNWFESGEPFDYLEFDISRIQRLIPPAVHQTQTSSSQQRVSASSTRKKFTLNFRRKNPAN